MHMDIIQCLLFVLKFQNVIKCMCNSIGLFNMYGMLHLRNVNVTFSLFYSLSDTLVHFKWLYIEQKAVDDI